jgi:eukaryotic-like serine/threonine-protein kinase
MPKPNPPARYQKKKGSPLSGGYGVVEVWYDTSLDRDVAIKWTAPEAAKQLLSEVRALSNRPSPHIVEIYDVVLAQSGELAGLILEFLEGQSFDDEELVGAEGAIPAHAIALLYQLARGLADLHAVGLVHRDVKPANAVCSADGRLKIVDFGLSSPGTGAHTTEAKGTFAYAAPEFFGEPPIPITTAMDAYSFGMVCWTKLVGHRPKVGPIGMPDSTYYPLPSIATKAKLPAPLVKIIDLCLSWQIGNRPSMDAVASAFMAELTRGDHAACVLLPGQPPNDVSTDPTKVTTITTPHGGLDIGYDGYEFTIRKVHGDVFVNNSPAVVGRKLHEGCLLSFGARALGGKRLHIPFRQSCTEIVF